MISISITQEQFISTDDETGSYNEMDSENFRLRLSFNLIDGLSRTMTIIII